MKYLALTKGEVAIVDDCYLSELLKYNWSITTDGYAKRMLEQETYFLHWEIIKLRKQIIPEGFEVDHINRNKLDCLSENLRVVSKSVNRHNTERQTNTSGVKGVTYIERDRIWRANIKVNKLNYALGDYKDFHLAVVTRKRAEVRLLGANV